MKLKIQGIDSIETSRSLVKKFFKDREGNPFILTDGQAEIFSTILSRKYPRVHICTSTRYGKSDVVSMAVLLRVATYPEKWAIIAGEKEKASIIMQYVIGHIFDNPYTRARFIKGEESEESIRRHKSKERINFNVGDKLLGELFIGSAEGALGLGAPNIIQDESALINERDHALTMRMLGDQTDNFLVKIGNPFESEHFRESFADPSYHKIIIDYRQAIREGRLTQEYVEEMRKRPFFDILYECKFPEEGMADDKGWVNLFTTEEIKKAFVDEYQGFGVNKLGVDAAGGGKAYSVIVQRRTNVARVLYKKSETDTMNLVEEVVSRKEAEKIYSHDINIDKVGLGRGAYDLLDRIMPGVRGINAGSEPTTLVDKAKFVNLRAEMYWKAKEWIMGGGKLVRNEDWFQLTKIKYRAKLEGTKGKMVIISKEELAKSGVIELDVADAFAHTFVSPDIIPPEPEEERRMIEMEKVVSSDPFDPF